MAEENKAKALENDAKQKYIPLITHTSEKRAKTLLEGYDIIITKPKKYDKNG